VEGNKFGSKIQELVFASKVPGDEERGEPDSTQDLRN